MLYNDHMMWTTSHKLMHQAFQSLCIPHVAPMIISASFVLRPAQFCWDDVCISMIACNENRAKQKGDIFLGAKQKRRHRQPSVLPSTAVSWQSKKKQAQNNVSTYKPVSYVAQASRAVTIRHTVHNKFSQSEYHVCANYDYPFELSLVPLYKTTARKMSHDSDRASMLLFIHFVKCGAVHGNIEFRRRRLKAFAIGLSLWRPLEHVVL